MTAHQPIADNSIGGADRNIGWIGVCQSGPLELGEERVRPIRDFGPPIDGGIERMSYSALQSMFGASAPGDQRVYWRRNRVLERPRRVQRLGAHRVAG